MRLTFPDNFFLRFCHRDRQKSIARGNYFYEIIVTVTLALKSSQRGISITVPNRSFLIGITKLRFARTVKLNK